MVGKWGPASVGNEKTGMTHCAVVSLRWVSPGAATEGVTPIFFLKKLAIFSHHCLPVLRCHCYLFSAEKLTTFFARNRHFYWFHPGVTPLKGVTPHFFYLSDLVCPLFIVYLPTKIFPSGVTPLEGVTRGGPSPPPSDATVIPLTDERRVCS